MASNIQYTTIDAQYPAAGKANSTQGFRDNFDVIKTGLQTAKEEITELQADTAKISTDNDFLGNKLSNAELNQTWLTVADFPDEVSGDVTVEWSTGAVQQYLVAESSVATFTIEGWPETGRGSEIELWIRGAGTGASTIEFVAAGTILANVGTLSVDDTGLWVYRVRTIDAGATVLITELGKHE